jgi:predicted ATPase
VEYLQLAGQQAVQHSANAEAIIHLTTALELLKTLPDTQSFPVSKLERLRACRQRAVKSQESSLSMVLVARQRAQLAEVVRDRQRFRVAVPLAGCVSQTD